MYSNFTERIYHQKGIVESEEHDFVQGNPGRQFFLRSMYIHTLSETNTALETGWLEDVGRFFFLGNPFSGAMLVLERVDSKCLPD